MQVDFTEHEDTTPEEEKHNEEMVRKYEGQSGTAAEESGEAAPDTTGDGATGAEDRPAGLPEKFKSVEDMVRSYQELEKKLGGARDTTESTGEDGTDESKGDTDSTDAEETLASKGLDLSKYEQSYTENGALTEDDYKELEAAGLPKNVVDTYIKGQEALTEAFVSTVHETVGGADEYAKMIEWAKLNKPAEFIKEYDTLITSRNEQLALMAAKGLAADYKAAYGTPPKLLGGNGNVSSDTQGYQSRAEMVRAMRDPRYKEDEAYRNKVAKKLQNTNF
jgi:hypothetical protein